MASTKCEGCGRELRAPAPDGGLCERCLAALGIEDDVARDVGLKDEEGPRAEEEMDEGHF